MRDSTPPDSTPSPERSVPDPRKALARIAEALGRPVEALMGSDPEADALAGAAELVRCWFAIDNPQARQRILAAAKRAAGRAEEV